MARREHHAAKRASGFKKVRTEAQKRKRTEYEQRPDVKRQRGDRERFRAYGVTREHFDFRRLLQNYRCALCCKHEDQLPVSLAVDHCHDTGKVRGLLCSDCNTGLGKLGDNIAGLGRAKDYLMITEGYDREHS